MLYHECVPVLLSDHWEPPFSTILDWSSFSVRLRPTRKNLENLKELLAPLNHAALLAGVRRAKHALTYQLDAHRAAAAAASSASAPASAAAAPDMLPLLLHEMARVTAAGPITPPSGVSQLYNDIVTDKDYDAGLKNVQSQRAHDVYTRAGVSLPSGEVRLRMRRC